MPANLARAAAREGRLGWLAGVPATVRRLAECWALDVGPPFEPGGVTAWVAPATDGDGAPLVLKVLWYHPEAAREAAALRLWDGDGAVRLLAVDADDDGTIALLLERCVPGTALSERPEPDQDTVIAALLRRLWREPPADHDFESLQVMCDLWADGFEAKMAKGSVAIDPGLARDGIALFRALPASADRAVVLCTDLHAGNVLAAERERWLAIDPKPYVGDPTYDALQHLLNCPDRLAADPWALVRRMSRLLEVDPDRLMTWLFARCVQESPDWPELGVMARRIAPS
jgi:streptomycin 6-kinase